MGDEKVYVVVGEWRGLVDEVEVYRKEERAEAHKQGLIGRYGKNKVEIGDCTVQVHECVIIE